MEIKITFNKASFYEQMNSLEEAALAYGKFIAAYQALSRKTETPADVVFYGDSVPIAHPITKAENKGNTAQFTAHILLA